MINPEQFYSSLSNHSSFFTGVPDSLLKELNSVILDKHPSEKHIIAANEGISVSLGIGHFIATKEIAIVYIQNSGLGNIVNPIISLANKRIYGVPMLLIIGWRGEPGLKDEPQHITQGKIQEDLLKSLEIPYQIIDEYSDNYEGIIQESVSESYKLSNPLAILVRKNTFSEYDNPKDLNQGIQEKGILTREAAINTILKRWSNTDSFFVGTTGKTSRELFELRAERGESHNRDFLTVGGMGHAISIATGVSMNAPTKTIVCLDGDGSLLMHTGSLVSTTTYGSKQLVHIVLNNGIHDSVGGQPTLINNVNCCDLASSMGYKTTHKVEDDESLKKAFEITQNKSGPHFIEFSIKSGSRKNLGRPTIKPFDNLRELQQGLSKDI
jgi:phosphonopyruvate decarboxylase